jgi:hypothetical protein
LTQVKQRNYINTILVPQLIQNKQSTPLVRTLINICKQDLQSRVDNKPQPPSDWIREMPNFESYFKKQWQILRPFMESPEKNVFDFRAIQSDRTEMESAIKRVTVDLKMETIKKGSPHTLRITKTQRSYQRNLKKWEEDKTILEQLNKTIFSADK